MQTLIDHFYSTLKISWYQFGIEAEYVVGIYLKSKGWSLEISKCSRGPADVIAIRHSNKWLIQVKSSASISRVKRYDVRRLIEMAKCQNGLPVIAILQPSRTIGASEIPSRKHIQFVPCKKEMYSLGNYGIIFCSLPDWRRLTP